MKFEAQVDSQGFLNVCTFPSWSRIHISMARPSGRMLLEESGRSETHRILGILAAFTFEKFISSRTHQDIYVLSKDDGIFPSRSLYPWEGEDFLGPDGRPPIRLKPTLC